MVERATRLSVFAPGRLVGLVAASLLFPPFAASAQPQSSLLPLGVTAYEASEDQCFYEKVVSQEITKVNAYFRNINASAWRKQKSDVAKQLGLVTNFGAMLNATSACQTLGLSVGQALQLSVIFIGFDPEASTAIKRLAEGGGRGINDPAPPEAPRISPPSSIADAPQSNNTKTGDDVLGLDTSRGVSMGGPNQINRINGDSSPGRSKAKTASPNAHETSMLGFKNADEATDQAKSAVREIIARATSSALTTKETANDNERFMTPQLSQLLMENRFNADPYTGSQEPGLFRLASIKSQIVDNNTILVIANFDIQNDIEPHETVIYRLVQITSNWKIDDIRYMRDDNASMRDILKRNGPG